MNSKVAATFSYTAIINIFMIWKVPEKIGKNLLKIIMLNWADKEILAS